MLDKIISCTCKQYFAAFLVLLLIVTWVPGAIHAEESHGNEESAIQENEPPAATEDPLEESTETPVEEPQPDLIPKDTAIEAEKQAIYDEYFAVDRVFVQEHLTYYNNQFYTARNGAIYSDTSAAKNETRVLPPKDVTEVLSVRDGLVFIQGETQLARSDHDGAGAAVVYKADQPISHLYANSELAFFIEGNQIKRLHFGSGIVDTIFKGEALQYVRAITSNQIVYGIPNPEWIKFYEEFGDVDSGIQRSAFYYFNYLDGTHREAEYGEVFQYYESIPADSVLASSAATPSAQPINGVDVPFDNYRSLISYFTTRTCDQHVSSVANPTVNDPNNHAHTSSCTWNEYTISSDPGPDIEGIHNCDGHDGTDATVYCRRYANSGTCVAFAKYVYDTIWGISWSTINQQSYRGSNSGNGTNVSYIQNLPAGSYVCVASGPYGSDVEHSFVVVSSDATGFWAYEANLGGDIINKCRVRYSYITYSGYTYQYLMNYVHPSVGCDHVASSTWTKDTNYHWKVCENCELEISGTRASHNLTYSNITISHHTQYCNTCGYDTQPHNYSLKVYNGNDTHTYKCRCGRSASTDECGAESPTRIDNSNHSVTCPGCQSIRTKPHDGGTGSYTNLTSQHFTRCTICNGEIYSNHFSTYGWSYNSTIHYKICSASGCGAHMNEDVHNWGGIGQYNGSYHVRYCNTCGVAEYIGHSFYGSGHYNVCACGYSYYLSHNYSGSWTYYTTGQHRSACSYGGCGMYYYDGHSPTTRQYSTTQHRTYCSSCASYYNYASHTFSGTTCTKCGYRKGGPIPMRQEP